LGKARKCEELCMVRCEEPSGYGYLDCVNECMRLCLTNLAGESA
jgi:hypothetical protein